MGEIYNIVMKLLFMTQLGEINNIVNDGSKLKYFHDVTEKNQSVLFDKS